MANPGDHEDVPHTLIPLGLAVGLVRSKVYAERRLTGQGLKADLNVLASFIAGTVPVYEYATDPSKAPRALRRSELEGGMFRDGGKELFFIDGRATKRYLAVNAVDVECVTSVLRDPERAVQIRSRFVRLRARKLRDRAAWLRDRAAALRRESLHLRSRAEDNISGTPFAPAEAPGG